MKLRSKIRTNEPLVTMRKDKIAEARLKRIKYRNMVTYKALAIIGYITIILVMAKTWKATTLLGF